MKLKEEYIPLKNYKYKTLAKPYGEFWKEQHSGLGNRRDSYSRIDVILKYSEKLKYPECPRSIPIDYLSNEWSKKYYNKNLSLIKRLSPYEIVCNFLDKKPTLKEYDSDFYIKKFIELFKQKKRKIKKEEDEEDKNNIQSPEEKEMWKKVYELEKKLGISNFEAWKRVRKEEKEEELYKKNLNKLLDKFKKEEKILSLTQILNEVIDVELQKMLHKFTAEFGNEIKKAEFVGTMSTHNCDKNAKRMRKNGYDVYYGFLIYKSKFYDYSWWSTPHWFNVKGGLVYEFTNIKDPNDKLWNFNDCHYFGKKQ